MVVLFRCLLRISSSTYQAVTGNRSLSIMSVSVCTCINARTHTRKKHPNRVSPKIVGVSERTVYNHTHTHTHTQQRLTNTFVYSRGSCLDNMLTMCYMKSHLCISSLKAVSLLQSAHILCDNDSVTKQLTASDLHNAIRCKFSCFLRHLSFT